jgi:hypothetical protein
MVSTRAYYTLLSLTSSSDRDYKWSHDLAKHRRLKHPQEGEAPPPTYHCLEPDW